jgi:acetyl/propionyl-CoA carboxylase alpha subunit
MSPTLLIANRGEVALRIIRTATEPSPVAGDTGCGR